MDKKAKSNKTSRTGVKGTRLGASALVAQALSAQGLSSRTVAQITGISATSVLRLARKSLIPPEHADGIRSLIRDQFAVVAGAALSKVTDEKLDDSSALELLRIAALAGQQAGFTAPSVIKHFHAVMEKYRVVPSESADGTHSNEELPPL